LTVALLLAGTARGQQVVSYFAAIPQSSTDWAQTFQLPGFDSRMGTLTQVKLSFTGEVWQSLFAENKNATGANYDLSVATDFALGKSDGTTLLTFPPISLQRTGTLGIYDGALDWAGTSGVTFDQHVSESGIYLDSSLSGYLAGPVIFSASTLTAQGLVVSGGNSSTGISASAAAQLSVEYTCTAIPEPSTYAAILGMTALGIVTIRRRKT